MRGGGRWYGPARSDKDVTGLPDGADLTEFKLLPVEARGTDDSSEA